MKTAEPGIAPAPVGHAPTEEVRGFVFNLMRFCLHNGPGIRTTVFLKGCPLACDWCQNPEGQSPKQEVAYFLERCIVCGDCIRACPENALQLSDHVVRDPELCRLCGTCVEACQAGAREVVGRSMSVPEVLAEIMRDEVFFDESGGGVTISGGEPLTQAAFVEALLIGCRERRIHTALDTCGFASPSVLRRVSEYVDLFLYDLKLMDSEQHQRYTCAKNDLILANLNMLAESGKAVIVRVPVIPGINDTAENIEALSRFLLPLGLQDIDLLPYHRIGTGKYERLRMTYTLRQVVPPTAEHVDSIAARLTHDGFKVRIGG